MRGLFDFKERMAIPIEEVEPKEAIFKTMGGVKAGSDTLLSKPVTIWQFKDKPTSEIWEWNGIILKEVKNIQNLTYSIEANEIKTDVEINPELFELDENIKLTQE